MINGSLSHSNDKEIKSYARPDSMLVTFETFCWQPLAGPDQRNVYGSNVILDIVSLLPLAHIDSL